MYNTSQNYKEKILKDSTQHELNIYIDGNKVEPNHIIDFSSTLELFNNNEFCLGCTPEIDIEFEIDKRDLPESYNEVYVETGIGDEIIPIGKYTIQSVEDDEFKVKIKATDYMKKFEDTKYDGSNLIYPKTILEVLEDICKKVGVELGSTSFLNSDKQIAVYDNTLTARTYIGYIAEQAEGFAVIGRDGKLYIKTFGEDTIDFNINLFGDFTWGDKFKVSKVSYEDGIQNYKFGDETQATVFIDQNNMYIVDREQIENIYNKIKDFELYTFEGETIIDPAYDIGDVLIIDGKKILYQGELKYAGKFKASIKSKIQAKTEQESMQTKQNTSTKIRKIKSQIDQAEGKIKQLVEETTEYSKKITQVEQTVDGISQKVENIQDFTKEKEQIENLYIDDIAGGEGYLLDFIIFGNTELFKTKDITICASENKRGYGDSISLFLEDGNELLTEDNKQILIKHEIQYIKALKITLDDYLRNFVYEGNEYCDTLEIKQDGTIKIIKRIGVDDEGNLYLLEKENEIILKDKIVLPSQKESGTYYFIKEIHGIKYYAKYITKNDYSDAFLTELELGTKLEQNAEHIRVAWNQISQYIQMEGIEGKATLNIYDKENNILVSLNQNGENFYNSENKRIGYIGIVRGKEQDTLAFVMDVDWENGNEGKSMAWGYNDKNGKFLPIFHLVGSYGSESGEYGGKLVIEGELSTEIINVINQLNFVNYGELIWNDGKTAIAMGNSFRDVSREVLCFKTEDGLEFKDVNKTFLSMYDNTIWIASPFWVGKEGNTSDTGWTGYPMIGVNDNNSYYCQWSGNQLYFYVDGTQAGWISDKRLKKDFKEIDDDFLKAIDELKIQQFKADNRNGLISFGIIAQDLEKSFKKYNINPSNYEILQKIQYKLNEKELYYTVEYTQFLILKQLASERKIQKLQEKDIEKDKTIQDLLKRIERLEEKS